MVKGFSSEIMNQHSWFLFIEKEKISKANYCHNTDPVVDGLG